MLERTRQVKKGQNHLKYLKNFDVSEVAPAGQVSQRIFEGILNSRLFDGYDDFYYLELG